MNRIAARNNFLSRLLVSGGRPFGFLKRRNAIFYVYDKTITWKRKRRRRERVEFRLVDRCTGSDSSVVGKGRVTVEMGVASADGATTCVRQLVL